MTDKEKNEIALFRFSVISGLISGIEGNKSKADFFREMADKEWIDPRGNKIKISESTIERWYIRYKRSGFDSLKPRDRSDCGSTRKLDDEAIEIIKHYIEKHPRLPATAIYDEMIKNGYISYDDISLNTLQRYVRRLKDKEDIISHTELKRYEAPHINLIWSCDTTYSFKLNVGGTKKRMYIIGIIDDASRLITGIDVFFNDNYVNFMLTLKKAIRRYGKPKMLNLDNGAPYKNKQIEILAARLGITLHHCAPYSGWQKGKIERWFRTMKDHFMASYDLKDKTTIEEFKNDLEKYVDEYNNTIHKSLENKSPISRFFDSGEEIIKIDDETLENNFLLEIERKASIDCVIQIDNKEFEVPQKYSNKKIKLRYSPDYRKCYVVASDNTLTKIELLDKIANSKIKRKQPIFNTEVGQ